MLVAVVASGCGKRPAVTLDASGPPPSRDAATTAAPSAASSDEVVVVADGGPCLCPSLDWADGPALGSWRRISVDRECRVTIDRYETATPHRSCARLACDGERGARRLAALAAAPSVRAAFANHADYGARAAVAVDHRALRVHADSLDYGIAAPCATAACDAPPAVVELANFFESGLRAEDGGERPAPPLTAMPCAR